jgi:hypothetical protein
VLRRDDNPHGFWGGTSLLQRRAARQRGLTAAELLVEIEHSA